MCAILSTHGSPHWLPHSSDGRPNAYHLILLVMNHEGYKNLSRLVTLGHLEGFYYHPRVDMELLKEFNGGLIALSACLKGMVPFSINTGRIDTAREKAKELVSIFDNDRFFLKYRPITCLNRLQ